MKHFRYSKFPAQSCAHWNVRTRKSPAEEGRTHTHRDKSPLVVAQM